MPKNITNNDLYVEFVKLNARIDEQNERFVTKEENHKVLDLVDKVLGEVIAMRQEQAVNSQRFDDTDIEIGSLKKRVKKIEDHHQAQQP